MKFAASPISAFLLVVLVAGVFAYSNDGVGQRFGPSCTVSVSGTAASLVIQGWNADADCQAQLGPGVYSYIGETRTPVVCQLAIGRDLFTVHDEGTFKFIGNALCLSLDQMKRSPQPTRSPTPARATPTPSPVHTSGPGFASCRVTPNTDRFGNLIWTCPNAPSGYVSWTPPADARGDWTAYIGEVYPEPGGGDCKFTGARDTSGQFYYTCPSEVGASCYPPIVFNADAWICKRN